MLTVDQIISVSKMNMQYGPSRRSYPDLEKPNLSLRIKHNIEQTKSYNDNLLRICNANDEHKYTNVVAGIKSKDPVYRKISKAQKYAHRSSYNNLYWSNAGIIHDIVNNLQIKLENRTMKKEEYEYLKNNSMKTLLNKWNDEINHKNRRLFTF